MGKFRITGCPISVFDEMLESAKEKPEIVVREARLIPASKKIDEMFLSSVFLSSLTLIKEFRTIFSKEIGMSRVGSIRAYTEVSFPNLKVLMRIPSTNALFRLLGSLSFLYVEAFHSHKHV